MLGAIIGDIVGSRFEFHNHKDTDFDFFAPMDHFTDDTVMTVAIADALMAKDDPRPLATRFVAYMQKWGRKYPHASYGGRFRKWIWQENPQPYNSWGNGSAMRVSPAGWVCESLRETTALAELTAIVTHNHPEGLIGAKAIADSMFLARAGATKDDIREYVRAKYGPISEGYRLDFTLDEIRPAYEFDVSCQGSCPQAIEAFLESDSFENAIRLAVSIGGDSDTIAAMTGAIAEAHYGIPKELEEQAMAYLPQEMADVVNRFRNLKAVGEKQ